MQRSCRQCTSAFEVTDDDIAFFQTVSPVFAGVRYDIPPPTLCPDCRAQRRYTWRNERTLYKRTCALTGKPMLSAFSADKPFTPYSVEAWYGDGWDPKEYGRDFDFSRPFFPQFRELMEAVPELGLSVVNVQNSDYINQAGDCKNCYLIFHADENEDCMYANYIYGSRSCLDILEGTNLELCYECAICRNSYALRHSVQCENCTDSWFLRDCIGCKDCIGCVNLRNKRFHIFNTEYPEEEYRRHAAAFALHTRAGVTALQKQFDAFSATLPFKAMYGTQNEESSGNYLWNTQRCINCFECQHSQDCKYVVNCQKMKNAQDILVFGGPGGSEVCYECHEVGNATSRCAFSNQLWGGVESVYYSKLCLQNCHDLFGCASMKHASYCILNKQYTKEEYETLVPQIIEHMRKTGEWGEFFPVQLSQFGYNETIALQHCPMTKDDVLARGWAWKDPEPETPLEGTVISGEELPDSIDDVTDAVLQTPVRCAATGKLFRITRKELDFYRSQRLPLPIFDHGQRHQRRMRYRNPRKLWTRPCMKCGKDMQTAYAPDRPEIVYCEECYLQEVY